MSDAGGTANVKPNWARRVFGDFNPLRVAGGFLLAVLVVGAAASAVIFFAATQFQSRISELALNGAPLTIWRVDAFRVEFKDWRKDIRSLRASLNENQDHLTVVKQKIIARKVVQGNEEIALSDAAFALARKVLAASAAPARAAGSDISGSKILTEIELMLTTDDLRTRFGSELNALRERFSKLQSSSNDIDKEVADTESAEIQIKALDTRLKERIDSAGKLFGAANTALATELVERIINVSSELESLSEIWGRVIYSAALWTNDMLVLLLLISMGILGSALNLLAIFFTNDKDSLSFGEYPLRLAFGAVLAIVMYIIAKAGVPILADTTRLGGTAPLNPYFISLLAVVSGLMSDRAMGTIRNVATNLLQSVGGGDFSSRYTQVDLDAALTAAKRDIDGLARVLGIKSEEVKKLFSGNDTVTPDRQKLIAAYLGRPIRELYSDIPAN
jgi:hypothetical protein